MAEKVYYTARSSLEKIVFIFQTSYLFPKLTYLCSHAVCQSVAHPLQQM